MLYPYTRHIPIPIPYNWKEQIKASLDQGVARGTIAPVPIGTLVTCCSPMVIITKKDGTPRRTIALQLLTPQCHCETHPCLSPFQLACQILKNIKETVLDAVDDTIQKNLILKVKNLQHLLQKRYVICT